VEVVVDTEPPVLTVESEVEDQLFGPGVHALSGAISDDLGVDSVLLCQSECSPVEPRVASSRGLSGTWTARLPLPEDVDRPDGDGVSLTLYGVDKAGNRSAQPVKVTYRVDLTPPVLTVSDTVAGVPPGWAEPVVEGAVEDGSSVSVYAHVRSPEGVDSRSKARLSGDDWFYGPAWTGPGVYRLWLQAVDGGGNTAEVGPFTTSVGLAPRSYLPIVTR
jgi:hypothetical protein